MWFEKTQRCDGDVGIEDKTHKNEKKRRREDLCPRPLGSNFRCGAYGKAVLAQPLCSHLANLTSPTPQHQQCAIGVRYWVPYSVGLIPTPHRAASLKFSIFAIWDSRVFAEIITLFVDHSLEHTESLPSLFGSRSLRTRHGTELRPRRSS